MNLDKCKKCPHYMMHFKNEVLCNYLYEVNRRSIGMASCIIACPVE